MSNGLFNTRASALKDKEGSRKGVENLLAFPRLVAKAVLLITSRQTNRCKQTKQGKTSALVPKQLSFTSLILRAPCGWGVSPFY